jgi:predicted dehydrogenase
MTSMGRRHFVTTSLGAAAAVAATPRRALAAGERVSMGVIGIGGRGSSWVRELAGRENVEVRWLCDVDATRFERPQELLDAAGRKPPKTTQDFRKVLEDPDVQAVLIATNQHWHALPTILACQAGKDVYVEKPGFHNPWEGRKVVEAARKYERVVQVGLQNRSAPYVQTARDYVGSGRLGDIHLIRVLNMNRDQMRPKGDPQPVPASLDWDTWCGPGPLTPYSPGRWHVNRFDYSAGYNSEDAVHQLDLMRYLTGLGSPETVVHSGGVLQLADGRDAPDTQIATFEYPGGLTLSFQATLWAYYVGETPSVIRDGDEFPDWLFNGTKIELFGTEGMMLMGRMGGGWQAFDNDGRIVEESYGRQASSEHMTNFLDCVASRQRPVADIEEIYASTLLIHLANTSYRAGNRKLAYDAGTGWIEDDAAANAFMKRAGRAPWRIPDEV